MKAKTRKVLAEIVKASFVRAEKKLKNCYDDEELANRAKELNNSIRKALKKLYENRYKIVVSITIGQVNNDSLKTAYRCYWDEATDLCTSYVFINDFIYCIVSAFAVGY